MGDLLSRRRAIRLLTAGALLAWLAACTAAPDQEIGYVSPANNVSIIPEEDRRPLAGELRGPSVRDHPGELVVGVDDAPIVINVWASWCPPCRAEAPDLESAAKTLPEVTFVGLNGKEVSVQNGQAFQRSNDVTFDSIFDPDGEILTAAGLFPTTFFPSTAVIDSQGRVAARVTGPIDADTLVALVADVG